MDTSIKVLLIAFSIIAVARSEQNTTKKIPVKSGNLLLDYNWPRMKSGLSRFPHRSSCYHFYSPDSEGQFKLRKCPAGLIFDYLTLKCGRGTLSQCWSSQFDRGYKPLYHRKHFHCPLPWGRYPDILNCKKYFQCRAKKALHRTCPNSTLFDKTKSKCVPQALAICSDKAEVEKYYKCPRSRGLFMYSRDCSKYHKCRQRISKLRSCKLGYLFDPKSSRCLPKDEVDCGRRYNPYNQSDEATTVGSDVQRSTATQGVDKGTSQKFLVEASQNIDTKTPELPTNISAEFPDDSSEISDESSSDEHFNSTTDIVTDDSDEDILFGTTDSHINSSFEEHSVREVEAAHDSSLQEFVPRTAETAHERSSTSMAREAHEDFPGGVVVIDSSNSSTDISTEAVHKNSSEDVSTEAAHRNSSEDVSTEVAHKNSSEDISPGTAEVIPEMVNISTDAAGATHGIPSQDIVKKTSIIADGNLSTDLSTGTVHSDSSEDFSTESAETIPFIKEILKYNAGNPEELQVEPFVKLVNKRFV